MLKRRLAAVRLQFAASTKVPLEQTLPALRFSLSRGASRWVASPARIPRRSAARPRGALVRRCSANMPVDYFCYIRHRALNLLDAALYAPGFRMLIILGSIRLHLDPEAGSQLDHTKQPSSFRIVQTGALASITLYSRVHTVHTAVKFTVNHCVGTYFALQVVLPSSVCTIERNIKIRSL